MSALKKMRRPAEVGGYLAAVQPLAAGTVSAAEAAEMRCQYCGAAGHHILVCIRLEVDKQAYLAHLKKLSAGNSNAQDGPSQPDAAPPVFAQDSWNRKCQCQRCLASFAMKGEPRQAARWCAQCRPAGAVQALGGRRCECERAAFPSFGVPGTKHARWCSKCPDKPADAVDVVSKRCECGKSNPSFALPGGTRKDAVWCQKCPGRPANSVNTVLRLCACGKTASYGFPGQTRKWCNTHKPEGARNLVTKLCECGKHVPAWGLLPAEGAPQRVKPRWCRSCPQRPADAISCKEYLQKRKRGEELLSDE